MVAISYLKVCTDTLLLLFDTFYIHCMLPLIRQHIMHVQFPIIPMFQQKIASYTARIHTVIVSTLWENCPTNDLVFVPMIINTHYPSD